jgi:DNA repair exonuclease SbcCD ATPase subunit
MMAGSILGCASSGRSAESEKAIGSMQDVINQLDTAKAQITKANTNLDALSTSPDLTAAFKNLSDSANEIKSGGDAARERWASMQARGQEYVAKWQADMETIQSPEIKQSMEQRRELVRANYAKITEAAKQTREAYDPYLKDLQDIQKALSMDMNPAGVKAMASPIAKGKADGQTLLKAVDLLQTQLKDVMKGMTPPSTPTTGA